MGNSKKTPSPVSFNYFVLATAKFSTSFQLLLPHSRKQPSFLSLLPVATSVLFHFALVCPEGGKTLTIFSGREKNDLRLQKSERGGIYMSVFSQDGSVCCLMASGVLLVRVADINVREATLLVRVTDLNGRARHFWSVSRTLTSVRRRFLSVSRTLTSVRRRFLSASRTLTSARRRFLSVSRTLTSARRRFLSVSRTLTSATRRFLSVSRTLTSVRRRFLSASRTLMAGRALWAGVESPVGFLPFIASVFEAGIAPFLASIIVDVPFLLADGSHWLLDGFECFSRSNKSNSQLVAKPEVLLVEKTGIHPDHDIHRGLIPGSDQRDDSTNHLFDVVAVIAVPLAPPENRVHDFAFPNQLQRPKALHLLVCRIATLPLQGLVVIHHHRVQRQRHQHRLVQLQ